MADDIKLMDIAEFQRLGFLQEANRQFFHPRGLALELTTVTEPGFVSLSLKELGARLDLSRVVMAPAPRRPGEIKSADPKPTAKIETHDGWFRKYKVVRLYGFGIPERSHTHHFTLNGARRSARRWCRQDEKQGRMIEASLHERAIIVPDGCVAVLVTERLADKLKDWSSLSNAEAKMVPTEDRLVMDVQTRYVR